MNGTEIVLLVLLLLAVLTVSKGIRTVPQGEVWTVERFGAFTQLLQPGLNLVIPFIDQVGSKLNVQEVVLDIPEQSVLPATTPRSWSTASSITGSWTRPRRPMRCSGWNRP